MPDKKNQSEIERLKMLKAFTNSPSEGSVCWESAARMTKQNITAKTHPWILGSGITVYPKKATKWKAWNHKRSAETLKGTAFIYIDNSEQKINM